MRKSALTSISVLSCLLAFVLLLPGHLWAQEAKAEKKTEGKAEKKEKEKRDDPPVEAVVPPPLDKLWAKAQEMLQLDDTEGAARTLYLIHYYYPDDIKGEPSLWQAAQMQKELARNAKYGDWNKVLNRFRRYINYYPKSPRTAEAYFEVGNTYQAMHYYREALAYLNVFMERYPDSPLMLQALRSYRNAILRAGDGDDAEKVFKGWQQSTKAIFQLMGESGIGNLKSKQGDYQGAAAIYQKILAAAPDHPVKDPEILYYAGVANLRLNKMEIGREQLYHYLSLIGMVAERSEVLVELAESYFRVGEYQEAQKLYRQVIDEGEDNERAVMISKMRVTQYLDDAEITLPRWQGHNDLTDPEGDTPYLAVLEKNYRDPVAQDARFGMFKRYQARADLDKAYEVGRNFLRSATPEADNAVQRKQIGHILLSLVEELLKARRYQDIYGLYAAEYRHLKNFPSAKLHAMMGQAMEALNLYEPAAAFYYLALQWPMTEQEKADLYFRRANVYLAAKDYEALDRLLTYLRKIYKDKPEAGQVANYSAKLSAARGQIDQAHDFYDQDLKQPTFPEKRGKTADEALGLMVQKGRFDQAEAILAKGVADDGWITPEAEQGWWLRIGNGWRGKGDLAKAREAYGKGVAQGLPTKGDAVQEIHLYLGDVLLARGEQKEGLSHYQAVAAAGGNPLWKKMATERLTQHDLEEEMATLKKVTTK